MVRLAGGTASRWYGYPLVRLHGGTADPAVRLPDGTATRWYAHQMRTATRWYEAYPVVRLPGGTATGWSWTNRWNGYPVVRLPGGTATRWYGYPVVRLPGGTATRWYGYPVVRLPNKHLGHILQRHSEMSGMEWAIRETLASPDAILNSVRNPGSVVEYYKWFLGTDRGDKYVKVVVSWVKETPSY